MLNKFANLKLLGILCLLMFSMKTLGAGGYIAQSVTVTKVSSTSANTDAFWLFYSGGTSDNCSGKVKFQATFAGTIGTFDRAFSLASTALVTGKKIDIYSYTSTSDCMSAVSIDLTSS